MHDSALGRARGHRVDTAQEERVVGQEEVCPKGAGLLDHGEGGVDGEVHPPDRLVRVTGDEADAVPRLRGGGRVEALDDVQHVAQGQDVGVAHVGPAGIEPTTFAV